MGGWDRGKKGHVHRLLHSSGDKGEKQSLSGGTPYGLATSLQEAEGLFSTHCWGRRQQFGRNAGWPHIRLSAEKGKKQTFQVEYLQLLMKISTRKKVKLNIY